MALRDPLSHSVLLKRKRGEPNGCTHDQESIEEGGTGHTQATRPQDGQQNKGRDFGDIEDGGTGRKQDTRPKGGQQTKGRDFGDIEDGGTDRKEDTRPKG